MSFMNDSFLLESPSSKKLYQLIEDLPIFDFHCHLDAKVIYEDKPFNNIVDLWLDGDHYKWRLMRANGIPESKITGNADNEIKFEAWARTIGTAFGNPLFHFTHLELKNIFGVVEHLNENNWKEIYDHLNDCINEKNLVHDS